MGLVILVLGRSRSWGLSFFVWAEWTVRRWGLVGVELGSKGIGLGLRKWAWKVVSG